MTSDDSPSFFSNGGEMGLRMREYDWRKSAVGLLEHRSPTLKSMLSLMLESRFPTVLMWGETHNFFYNDAYIPILGQRHPRALGRPFKEIWPEIWGDFEPLLNRVRDGESLHFEHMPLRMMRNGFEEDTTFTFTYSPLRNESGAIDGLFCSCFETTEQLRAESALRDSEARWRRLFNTMQEGFFLAHAVRDGSGRIVDFRFLEMNSGFEHQRGIRAAYAVGRTVREVLPDIDEELLESYATVVDTGEPKRFETLITADGNRWFEVQARKTGVDQFSVLLLDVTARRAAEAALRKSEATFRGLAQAMPNQVWSATSEGLLDWVNGRTVDYAGISSDRLLGEGWALIVHPEDLPFVLTQWKEALREGVPYQVEFRLRSSNGDYRWHLARAMPVMKLDGTVEHWIGTNTDIEEQKHNEQELARLNENLESRVAERSVELELAHDALRQSQKMEAVGQLTGGIAHDFNNLLTGVIGGIDLLRARLAQGRLSDLDRYIDAIANSAQRAATLTHRLLAFSRRQPLKPAVVDVFLRVQSLSELFERTLGPSIRLDIVSSLGLWPVLCDPVQLESAMLNLVINARDAMPEGGVLTVETCNRVVSASTSAHNGVLADGDYVQLTVADTGQGVPAEVGARVFEPFFTTKAIGHGTGLGLSMCYGFARQSNGHICFDSEPGRGTRFMLYLPRYLGDRDVDASETYLNGPTAFSSTICKVLVVEDERVIREMIMEVLQERGCRCVQAADGDAAMALLESDADINLLITDVGLPGLNGRLLAERARCERPALGVLFITGYAEDGNFDATGPDSLVELLPKPFGVDKLLRAVQRLMHRIEDAPH